MTAEEIKKLRADRGLSQKDFGALLGVEQATVSRLENGEWEPSGPIKRLLEIMAASPTQAGAAA